MSKLDNNNTLQIPIMLIEHSTTDFEGDISWFVYGNEAFIEKTCYRVQHKPIYPLCPAKVENGKTKLPQKVRELLKVDSSSNISIYLKYGRVTLRKQVFIPEMR